RPGQHLPGDLEQQRPVAGIAEDRSGRPVTDGGDRQECVPRLAGVQAAEDASGRLGSGDAGREQADPFGMTTVELAHQQRGTVTGTATVKPPAGPSIRSPPERTAATTAGSGSLTSTSWPSRARQAATVPPIAPQPRTT